MLEDIRAYDGLVYKTARMFSDLVKVEREDLEQDLRMKIVKVRRTYDPLRSKQTEQAYVYSCVANYIKDLKKAAARRASAGTRIDYIEDHRDGSNSDGWGKEGLSRFEARYMHVTEDEVYAFVARFVWPSTVTDMEKQVAALLVMGYEQQAVAECLGVRRTEVALSLRCLREKLADWQPSRKLHAVPDLPPVESLPLVAA